MQQVVAVPQHRQDRQQRERSRKIVTPPLEGAQEQHEQSQFQGRGEQPQGARIVTSDVAARHVASIFVRMDYREMTRLYPV
ncbi:hypothetical protein, partial [Adlercreutzia sp. DFI.6.23]|uniref:hypothetical protein n=1 Tax=Adlercreutzia sp. DFI.6.23 TaxID=2963705 RepID=UPI0021092FC0